MVLGQFSTSSASAVTSPSFLMNVGYIVAGVAAGAFVTEQARDRLVDIEMQGGDLIYTGAGAGVTMMVLGNSMAGRGLATGMLAGGAMSELRSAGVI